MPVFVDNKKNTFQTEIDLNNFKSDLNEIAGIVVTHLNGINHNIIQLKKQIESHNNDGEKIYLIEDCAVAMGAQIDGQRVGTFGDFSFLVHCFFLGRGNVRYRQQMAKLSLQSIFIVFLVKVSI